MFFEDSTLAWILILGSSFASILGATVVFVDALVRRFTSNVNFSLADNKTCISSTLALSSGILVTLPNVQDLTF
ncbi:Zinc transporter [Entomophthora muscae]|uniref:Zinc transporter n=1 Tax=Entomophthora muscae TaxID=34485 RepID=A0ACC2U3N9_9FUNG|nr:Zinc transporter [Entomophthora muscae]